MGYMPNDFINGEGVSVSLWVSGCPIRCKGCHNPECWDFDYGYEVPNDLIDKLLDAIEDNGIQRNFSILGGEPLCKENRKFVREIIEEIKYWFPDIKIYVWTGYTLSELILSDDDDMAYILNNINVLVEGPYIEKERDISLHLIGSKNQHIIHLKD